MMKQIIAGALLTLGMATPALAQEGLSTKPDYDLIYRADRVDENAEANIAQLHQRAVTALQAKDYAAAELTLRELLQRTPPAADANFLMGLAKTGLEKWDEARGFMELAVASEPMRPEPKTRLGLIYAKFDRMDDARHQRQQLDGLLTLCGTSCPDATWIADGLRALDQALSSSEAASRVSAASLAAVGIDPNSTDKNFDPAKYSLVTFNDTHDLYDLLTQPGRCEPGKTAAPREPCALILYRPMADGEGSLAANFKPVFKVVSRNVIWAIHDKELQKVKIDNLYFDEEQLIGRKAAVYTSIALVGNAENDANCEAGKACLGHLVQQDMFRMYSNMPDSVVAVIWPQGMKDPGTTRIR